MTLIIVAVVIVGLLGVAAAVRPRDRGGGHDPYFSGLQRALKQAEVGRARILIDKDRLSRNLSVILSNIPGRDRYRIVVKSLPCLDLLRFIRATVGTDKLMVVHAPFLKVILEGFGPGIDVLLGKPIPVDGVKELYRELTPAMRGRAQAEIQWLVDTVERLREYQGYARQDGLKLRINLEIDIGLHRGGVSSPRELVPLLDLIQSDADHLVFSGFMGYEGHVPHAPGLLRSARGAALAELADDLGAYRRFIDAGRRGYPALFSGPLTFNCGGSGTYSLFKDVGFVTDIGIGGAALRPAGYPAHFLDGLMPAEFIAAPVLKKRRGMLIPFVEFLGGVMAAWNPNNRYSFEIYGGGWAGRLASPPGIRTQALTADPPNQNLVPNQTTLNGSAKVALEVGDFVFYHPLQSDAMFQFEDVLVVSEGRVEQAWKVFPIRY